jgi:phenylpropionate dioxygenase-like ring-hydroxylating dioxygenase large terminal subunit
MASKEDNEILTRIGPGTPMGNLFRQYWLPLLMSSELPAPDGPPKRVRILGEHLIAFRSSSGQVGLLADSCSHRGASLFFGRNEENGLRCVYHGWKYDVAGRCVDMPNEPAHIADFESRNAESIPIADFGLRNAESPQSAIRTPQLHHSAIKHVAYPCREGNGAIWTYMGPRSEPPPLPDLEWTRVPDGHYTLGKTWRECNWAQAMEGDIDNAHVPFLHSRLAVGTEEGLASQIMYSGRTPHLEVVDTPYGAMYGSRREANERQYNWRIIQFLFPSYSMITTGSPQDRGTVPSHMWIPIDDENTMQWGVRWNPTEPLAEGLLSISHAGEYLPNATGWLGQWRPVANTNNDYLIDREVQRTVSFSGIPSVPLQDKAVTEGMGVITDRTREHLGSTDAMIVRVRHRLIEAAKALRDRGATPPGVDAPELYRVRSVIVNLPKEANWIEATREVVKAFTGEPAASTV